jgi:nucleoside-diphosphate-sugar epimerase
MRMLVTGSTGFIGSHLVEALIRDGHDVSCFVRAESNTQRLKEQKITLVAGSYNDSSSLKRAVTGMDVVFHVGACIQANDWDTYFFSNTSSTVNLLHACVEASPGLRRFVFISSISAGGPAESGIPKNEADGDRPVSMYGRSKLLAEKAVLEYKDRIPVVVIRPPNVLGVRQKELTLFVRLMKKRILPLIGNRNNHTSIIFVQDLVRAMMLAAVDDRAVGEVYYVTDNHVYSWYELLISLARELKVYPFVIKLPYPVLYGIVAIMEAISSIFGITPASDKESLRMVRKYEWIYDSGKIRTDLDFEPQIQFEDGIRQIVSDYRAMGIL